MSVVHPATDPDDVVQALVYTLLDVFDATRDLYQTLKVKEKRDYEASLRAKGYPTLRRIEYVEDESVGKDEGLVMDKTAVTRQFEMGYQKMGSEFAVGDVLSQTGLQCQIIMLQNALVTTLLYGPTSNDSISHQLSRLNAASRTAGTSSVDILAAQLQRQQAQLPPSPRSSHSPVGRSTHSQAPPYPTTSHGASTSLVRYQEPAEPRSSSPVNTTILDWRGRLEPERTDAFMTGPASHVTESVALDLYCPYASNLQRHRDQQLSSSITSDPSPYCPHCKNTLHLSPNKAWEVLKSDDGYERRFQVSNRFVVKCHRDGADGQYACVLCSRHASCVSVCGDVKALIKHIWEDHSVAELKHEEDVTEVVELGRRDSVAGERRRDSGIGYSASRGSRRSASLGPTRSGRRSKNGAGGERGAEAYEGREGRWVR